MGPGDFPISSGLTGYGCPPVPVATFTYVGSRGPQTPGPYRMRWASGREEAQNSARHVQTVSRMFEPSMQAGNLSPERPQAAAANGDGAESVIPLAGW